MQDFRNLAVWQKAHALTLETYRATESFPRAELFGLTSQLRRFLCLDFGESCRRLCANSAGVREIHPDSIGLCE
jgi:hypothetical protein